MPRQSISAPPLVRTYGRVALLAALCAGTLALADGRCKAEDAAARSAGAVADPGRRASYVIGDRLKIAVFEQIRPEPPEADPGASAVERAELSGEYTVQEDGSVYVPFVGPVMVAGTPFAELEHSIGASLGAKLGSPVKIGIQVLEREPIYVAGPALKAGPYKYIPGMSVLHALILAGALDVAAGEEWRILDRAREKERLSKATERLSRLTARLDLLKGEREEAAPLATPVPAASKERLAEARTLLHAERAKRAEQEAAIETALQSYGTELSIQRDKLVQVEASLQTKAERLQSVNKSREHGTTTDIIYYQAASDAADAKERLHDAKIVLAQLEHKISDLWHERARLSIEVQVDREREIRDLQIAVSEDETTKATLGALLKRLPGDADAGPAGREFDVMVVRRMPGGLQRYAVRDDSPLEPGDILQVTPSQPSKARSGSLGVVTR
jgi:exopolysaccharide production protein ExoF